MQNINVNNHKLLLELYKEAFKGREDVVPRYWKKNNVNSSGYTPICRNAWQKHLCQKPCRHCPNKDYVTLSDDLLIKHIEGDHILGVYLLLEDNTCHCLAFDFDNHDGAHDPFRDVRRFYEVCEVQGIRCYLLRSKSGTAITSISSLMSQYRPGRRAWLALPCCRKRRPLMTTPQSPALIGCSRVRMNLRRSGRWAI